MLICVSRRPFKNPASLSLTTSLLAARPCYNNVAGSAIWRPFGSCGHSWAKAGAGPIDALAYRSPSWSPATQWYFTRCFGPIGPMHLHSHTFPGDISRLVFINLRFESTCWTPYMLNQSTVPYLRTLSAWLLLLALYVLLYRPRILEKKPGKSEKKNPRDAHTPTLLWSWPFCPPEKDNPTNQASVVFIKASWSDVLDLWSYGIYIMIYIYIYILDTR